MAESTVTFICKRTVVSTKPVPPGKYFSLSVIDQLMEKNCIRMVFYYPSVNNVNGKKFEVGDITCKLRESLSEMLTHFPAATGRLTRNEEGRWTVKCNDAGVRMVEARAKGSVEDWLKSVDRENELNLVYWEDMCHKPSFWSTFYVQVTEFEDGGFAIGLSCSHLLSDPTSATMFLKSWAQTTSSGKVLTSYFNPLPQRKPINNNSKNKVDHIQYTSLVNHYRYTIEKSGSIPILVDTKFSTVSLMFSNDMVKACIAKAQISDKVDEKRTLAFEALCGLFWVCISKAKGVINELVGLSLCLDMRSALGLNESFFGNCMVYNSVQTSGFNENDMSEAANGVARVVAEMDGGDEVMDLIEWLEKNDNGPIPLMNGCDLVCARLLVDSVDPYLAEFVDGVGPIRARYYVEPALGLGQVLVLPSPPREGPLSRVVMVTLPHDEMVKLCNDDLLLTFSPTFLMGLNKD